MNSRCRIPKSATRADRNCSRSVRGWSSRALARARLPKEPAGFDALRLPAILDNPEWTRADLAPALWTLCSSVRNSRDWHEHDDFRARGDLPDQTEAGTLVAC